MLTYRARSGDNLYTLAQRHLIRVNDFVKVQRINHIADPYRIPVGRSIKIPRQLLRYTRLVAKIVAYRGNVHVRSRNGLRPASIGGTVHEGDLIVTSADAFVSLGLPDDSIISLPSQSQVTIKRLRKISLTGAVEKLFAVEQGRVRAVVTPIIRSEDDFRISTPVAVAAVRGTEFRVAYQPGNGRSATEVLEGKVDVAAGGSPKIQQVAPGFGSIASAAGVGTPVPLLPAPSLLRPGRVQDEDRLSFQVGSLKDAKSYHVQIAQDAGFVDVVSETIANGTESSLSPIADGTWFVRLSAIDADGLEGLPATYGFERRLSGIEAAVDKRRFGRTREYLFRWRTTGEGIAQFRFQLCTDTEQGAPLIDQLGLTEHSLVITDLPPGTYHWRVMSLQIANGKAYDKWSPFERLVISRSE
jgi:hypothetical protein